MVRAALSLCDCISQNSVIHLLPCSESLSLLGSCGSQNSSLLIFWWHHICVHVLVTFPDQGLWIHIVCNVAHHWGSGLGFLYIYIFGADLSLTINCRMKIDSFKTSGLWVSGDPSCEAGFSLHQTPFQCSENWLVHLIWHAWRRAVGSVHRLACFIFVVIVWSLSVTYLTLLQNLCKISSSNGAGSRHGLHYAITTSHSRWLLTNR